MAKAELVSASPSAAEISSLSPLGVIENDIKELMRQVAEHRAVRQENERQQLAAMKKLLLEVIEALDAFDRVFRNVQAKDDQITAQMKIWMGNFRTIRRLLEKSLTERGIVKIENLDQGFDPRWHKVSEIVSDPSKPEGTIVEEVKAGYLWRDEILRKAEVVVVGIPEKQSKEKDSVGGE